MLLTVQVHAAEWWAQPDIELRGSYNDNVRITSLPHDTVWETDLDISSSFGMAKENQGLSGNALVSIRRYTGGTGLESSEALDREDYIFNVSGYHRTELNTFNGNVGYTRDSTLDSELDETGLVDNQRATRVRKILGGSWGRTLTEKMRLSLGYQYSDINYLEDFGIKDLVPFKSDVFTASLGYQYSQRTSANIAASRRSFKPATGFNSNTLNISGGISGSFSETLSMSLSGGYRETTSDSLFATGFCIGADPGASFPECTGGTPVFTGTETGETVTSGPTYNIRLTKTLTKGSLSAELSRSTLPGQNGQLLDRNRFLLTGNHRLTARLRSNLNIQYSENETIVNLIGRAPDNVVQKFFRISPGFTWQWLREWTIGGRYQYARNVSRSSRSADQNAVFLTLSYRPTRLSISR